MDGMTLADFSNQHGNGEHQSEHDYESINRPPPHYETLNRPAPRNETLNRPVPRDETLNRPVPRDETLNRPVPRNLSFQEPHLHESATFPNNLSLAPLSHIVSRTHETLFLKHYKNLKIYMAFLLTTNLVLVTIVIWTCMFMNTKKEKPATVSSYVINSLNLKDNFQLCTKCENILESYGGIDGVIREIRMDEDRELCCFKRIGQMLDLFEQYASWYVEKNYKEGTCSADMSTARKLELLSLNKPQLHTWYKQPVGHPKRGLAPLNWFTAGDEKSSVDHRYFKFNGSHVIIPVDGDYYIYSGVHFNGSTYSSNSHFMQYHEQGAGQPIDIIYGDGPCSSTVLKSTFHGTFRLKKKSTVAVFGKQSSIITKDASKANYFGMYLV